MGDVSEHFSRWEFECDHCGAYRAVPRPMLEALERLRAIVGRPLKIVSGYRCTVWNARVGGIPGSQHRMANAVDIKAGYCTVDQAKEAGFVGIGVRRGRVIHLDMTPGRRPFVFDD